ncbi:shikimate kinase [Paenibacillus arenilitoris]|uniref:Shikimate kinase n=1 Tax=Paenibacillus arenilitoris TaxID=2772299 RepID=A0A927H8E9_9BACL|nr:shikimate kinase [Paenibacillus arenilitoris]MBD2871502.1 shikimate kinase [Paenibacillus arenilitoris]
MERQPFNKIVLIGFMGTGKSTISRLLSGRLGWARLDGDEEIERVSGKRISDIFAADGEAGFRRIETTVLESLLKDESPAIVATGGGAVLSEYNRSLMLDHAWVVALKASPEHIIERVKSDSSRPLLQGDAAERVHTLLEQRKHAYDFAHFTVDTTGLTAEQVASAIMEAYEAYIL